MVDYSNSKKKDELSKFPRSAPFVVTYFVFDRVGFFHILFN